MAYRVLESEASYFSLMTCYLGTASLDIMQLSGASQVMQTAYTGIMEKNKGCTLSLLLICIFTSVDCFFFFFNMKVMSQEQQQQQQSRNVAMQYRNT